MRKGQACKMKMMQIFYRAAQKFAINLLPKYPTFNGSGRFLNQRTIPTLYFTAEDRIPL